MVVRRKNRKPGSKPHKAPKPIKPASDARPDIFVARYLLHRNATRAAVEAGYSPKTAYAQGHRLLKRADIAAAVHAADARVKKRLAERYEVTAEKVTRELAKLGMSTMADYGFVDDEGKFQIDLSATPDEAFAALSSVKTKELPSGVIQTEIRLASKREALTDLGKITGLFKDGVDVTIPVQFIVERTGRAKREDA